MRNKHADLIIEWAETGCAIQCKHPDDINWITLGSSPDWSQDLQYRKKPTVVRYRNFLTNYVDSPAATSTSNNYMVHTHTEEGNTDASTARIEALPIFVRWLDEEWQEVEV